MIRSFRSRALRRYWERSDVRRLPQQDIPRIRFILDLLEAAVSPHEMAVHGLHFHALSGDRAGYFAVTVRGNWRITFAWDGEDAIEVHYEDYH